MSEDNIKIVFKETGCEGVEQIHLAVIEVSSFK